jgi:hypothetical protein
MKNQQYQGGMEGVFRVQFKLTLSPGQIAPSKSESRRRAVSARQSVIGSKHSVGLLFPSTKTSRCTPTHW